jgi:hypothetical protein
MSELFFDSAAAKAAAESKKRVKLEKASEIVFRM